MFHTSKDSFFLLSPKHTEGEFSIMSVPPSHTGHAGGTQLVHKAETEGGQASPTNHWPPLAHHSHRTTDCLPSAGLLEPGCKRIAFIMIWTKSDPFSATWPSGSWHFPCPPHLEALSSLSVSQSSPIVAYFHCREKVKHLTRGCRTMEVPGRKGLK